MENRTRVSDLDFVYISFKEPNKEENWADLKNKVPWAKRVDGVVGFDNAHKAAADVAETDFFISVDGDNVIDERFLLETLDFSLTNPKAVHRWRARNSVNCLVYGNGGIVGWPKQTCLAMKTHENSVTEENKIDFCWGVPHENLHNCYSTTVINHEPHQAFVAGYREGVKMSLDRGKRLLPESFVKKIWPNNLKTLSQWMSIGADVDHGKYAMLGARVGCYNTVLSDTDILKVSNLDELVGVFSQFKDDSQVYDELAMYGESLSRRVGIPIADLNAEQSKFFKFSMPQYRNKGVQDREAK